MFESRHDRVINSAWRARKRESWISRGSKLSGFLFPFPKTVSFLPLSYSILTDSCHPRASNSTLALLLVKNCGRNVGSSLLFNPDPSLSLSLSETLGYRKRKIESGELGNNGWGKVADGSRVLEVGERGWMTRGINDETRVTMSGAMNLTEDTWVRNIEQLLSLEFYLMQRWIFWKDLYWFERFWNFYFTITSMVNPSIWAGKFNKFVDLITRSLYSQMIHRLSYIGLFQLVLFILRNFKIESFT